MSSSSFHLKVSVISNPLRLPQAECGSGRGYAQLGLSQLGLHSLQAGLAALRDDRNKEVHDVDVTAERQQSIGHPSHELLQHLLNFEGVLPPEDAK